MPWAVSDLLGHRLVHRHGRAEHAGCRRRARWPARACPAPCRPRPSGRAAAAGPRVHLVGGRRRQRRASAVGATSVPAGSSRRGIACGPCGERLDGLVGQRPLALAGDADGRDVVALGVGGAQHVGGGDAGHVVLGGLPTEQHHEADRARRPSRAGPHRGPICRRGTAAPCESERRRQPRDRRSADRPRRRVRRRLVRLAVHHSRASCSCRSSPSATGTSSSGAARLRGAAAYLTEPVPFRRAARRSRSPTPARALLALAAWARSPLRSAGHRGHRLRRQDVHEGPAWPRRAEPVVARRRTSAASTTSRACPSRCSTPPTTPRWWSWRWACGDSATSPAVRDRPAGHRGRHRRRRGAHRAGRRHRGRGRRQGRTRRGAAARRGPPSSTPTIPGWRAMAARTGAAVLTFGAAGDVRVERHRSSTTSPGRRSGATRRGGAQRSRLARPRRAHGDQRGRGGCAVAGVVGVDLAGGRSGSGPGRRCPPCGWSWRPRRAARPMSTTPTTPTPRRCAAALESLAAMQADRRVAVLGLMAEIDDPRAGAPRDRRVRPMTLGIELIAVGTDLYGVEPLDGPSRLPSARSARSARPTSCWSRPAGRPVSNGWSPRCSPGRDRRRAGERSPPSSTARNADSGRRRRSHEPGEEEGERRAEPSTALAPTHSMTTPNSRLPIGTVPPNTMNHSGITVARSVFFMLSCSVVVIAVAVMK